MSAGTGTYRTNSTIGCTTASTTLNDPIQRPSGTPTAAARRKPAVTRKMLSLRSSQSFSSANSARAARNTSSGAGTKTGFIDSRWLAQAHRANKAAKPLSASSR